jgi:hypothetical protein
MVILTRAGQSTSLERLNEHLGTLLAQGATAEVQGRRARELSRPRLLQDARVICTSGRLLWRYHHSSPEQTVSRVPLYGLRVQSWTLEPAGTIVVYAQGGERLRLAPAIRGRWRRQRYSGRRAAGGHAAASTAGLGSQRR